METNGGMSNAERRLIELLKDVKDGSLAVEEALEKLRILPYEDLGFARLDHHRSLRMGFPEVVFAQGKTPDQVADIMARLAEQNGRVLATRASADIYQAVRERLPDALYHAIGRLIVINRSPDQVGLPGIVIASAGTADMPVAEEVAITAELIGKNEVVMSSRTPSQ